MITPYSSPKDNRFARRTFLKPLAAFPAAACLTQFPLFAFVDGTAEVIPGRWTSSAFIVNGRPRFLAAGSIDYFRCPPQHWRDRLLKAKRAGLNTIMTYVAWNMHEPEEGKFFFSGISDIRRYLEICGELQMMCIVRVGPFICDEWEAGGWSWTYRDDLSER